MTSEPAPPAPADVIREAANAAYFAETLNGCGFDHQRDAYTQGYETGWVAALAAAPPPPAAALALLDQAITAEREATKHWSRDAYAARENILEGLRLRFASLVAALAAAPPPPAVCAYPGCGEPPHNQPKPPPCYGA